MGKHPVAAIDIGSNTVHLLVGYPRAQKPVKQLASESALVELGAEVEKHGGIRADKARDLLRILKRQVRRARRLGAKEILIVATGAVRTAQNGTEVVKKLQSGLGLPIRILPSRVEGELAFRGACADLQPKRPQLLIDSGGESTEVTLARGRKRVVCVSLGIGAAELSAQLKQDPPGPLEWAGLSIELASALGQLPTGVRPVSALVVGGTAHRVAELTGKGVTAPARLKDLEAIARMLLRRDSRHIARKTGVEQEKVALLAAGTLVLHSILKHYGVAKFRVGRAGLREGMLAEYQARPASWWRTAAR